MSVNIRDGLTYDDVLLEPVYSRVATRRDVDLKMGWALDNGIDLGFEHPLVPANMDDVAGIDLLRAQLVSGGLAIMHRFQPVGQQVEDFQHLQSEGKNRIAASIGVDWDDFQDAKTMVGAGIGIICVDVAHGDHYLAERQVAMLKDLHDAPIVIAGNVATKGGAKRLFQAGADIVKVGVGPGSLCTTRIETGCGVPQLTAVMDVTEMRNEFFPFRGVIADGGIKNAGDCVKALCFADMVMIGNLFAGTDEAPGFEGGNYKSYNGSSTHKTNHVEGVRARVKKRGPFDEVLRKLLEGIRSGCSYQGSENLHELKQNPQLVRITSAGLTESYPHDVEIVRDEG
jgi:IMP dehydrogenase